MMLCAHVTLLGKRNKHDLVIRYIIGRPNDSLADAFSSEMSFMFISALLHLVAYRYGVL